MNYQVIYLYFFHLKCGRNGCKFEAADKLVQIHIRNVK